MTATDSERLLLPSTIHTRYQSIGPTEPEDEVKLIYIYVKWNRQTQETLINRINLFNTRSPHLHL